MKSIPVLHALCSIYGKVQVVQTNNDCEFLINDSTALVINAHGELFTRDFDTAQSTFTFKGKKYSKVLDTSNHSIVRALNKFTKRTTAENHTG